MGTKYGQRRKTARRAYKKRTSRGRSNGGRASRTGQTLFRKMRKEVRALKRMVM